MNQFLTGKAGLKKTLFIILSLCVFTVACKSSGSPVDPGEEPTGDPDSFISEVDSASYNIGILLYNADQGKEFWTEFNTQIRPIWSDDAGVALKRVFIEENPFLQVQGEGGHGLYGVRFSTFKTLFDNEKLPGEISEKVSGLSFNAFSQSNDTLQLEILDVDGNILADEEYILEPWIVKTYGLSFESRNAKEIHIYSTNSVTGTENKFGIDDIYLKTSDSDPFTPPLSDTEFLSWLKEASYNFFEWNYTSISNEMGVILESYTDDEKVSLSGIGYAYAIYILAAEEGFITTEIAKERIVGMLNWQLDQNWSDGTGGWHGFPHHYFKKDGSLLWNDVSTIDWAICAAGLRVVRQYYSGESDVVSKVNTLLNRPDWNAALAENNKIAMGFDSEGNINDYRWGLAFSEETEIVYLEAVASGDLDAEIFDSIIREKRNGFYPSWFGAGFTYNWLQLWTGPLEPYNSNSIQAYQNDAQTSLNTFGVPIMGLTACSTVRESSDAGFFRWGKYISNQGGSIHLSRGGVIQVSPAAYGAALALPFTYENAIEALRKYADLGYYHEYLGLPDNVRMKGFSEEYLPAPNWDTYDINIGPLIMSIEQINENRIAQLFQADPDISQALSQLIDSFSF